VPRSSWNSHSPDTIGIEFQGVGASNNVIATNQDMWVLRFRAQQSGTVSQVSVFSGAQTNNPLIFGAPGYVNQRRPWLIELIPVSGFDPGPIQSASFTVVMTANSDVVDESFTTPENDELDFPNDGLALFQSGPNPAQVTVQMSTANTFPLTAHVLALGIDTFFYRQTWVDRIDNDGGVLWQRLFPSGYSGTQTMHIAEAYIDHFSPNAWSLWTPTLIRQFASSVGSRRLRLRAVDTQPNIFDWLNLHVDYITERRAGVGIIVPTAPYLWHTGSFFVPGTANPVPVTAGVEYVAVVRAPCAQDDYISPGSRYDLTALNDMKIDGITPVHYTFLDWDLYTAKKDTSFGTSFGVPTALDVRQQGLPAIRFFQSVASTESLDTEPYLTTYSGVRPLKSSNTVSRAKHTFALVTGTTKYRYVRTNVALLRGTGTPTDPKTVSVTLKNNVGTTIAGPALITESLWDDSPKVGNDIWGDEYHSVLVDLGTSVDIADATASTVEYVLDDTIALTDDGTNPGNPWRIGALASTNIAPTGSDQTAAGVGQGLTYRFPNGSSLQLHDPANFRRGDLQVMLISEVAAVTGASVSTLTQLVSGGACDPCDTELTDCLVRGITYNHVCWSATKLTQDTFVYYEVQRREMAVMDNDWVSVAFITPTGSVTVTGAAVTGAPTCWDDWSMVYGTQVCYRVRQKRIDGALSDFVETVCVTSQAPTGADLIITAPLDPTLNVAFPETYGATLPIEREWEVLDSDQHVYRQVYGRDGLVAFRPLEQLGLRFKRKLLIQALCTPVKPCIDVMHRLHEICRSTVGLVVRDTCGNRWYAGVQVPTFTNFHDPYVGDIWTGDIVVTEVTTPVVTAENAGSVAA
jgi:hypothetical protein